MNLPDSSMESFPILGGCHCGNIRFSLQWPSNAPGVPVRKCGCTFCTKHGGAWTSHPDAALSVKIGIGTNASGYQFGTATADFHVCSVCGCVPFVSSQIDNVRYAVVNVNTFESVDKLSFDESATDFSAEDTAVRLARRKRNWIPDVQVSVSDGHLA
jgi:hypothetical protein